MYGDEINLIGQSACKKIEYMKRSPWGYVVASCLAGIYVGFGIILIFAIGGPIQAAGGGLWLKLVMGASFGIALSLVIFAGCELFTGNNMAMVIGALCRKVRLGSVGVLFLLCYVGNLIGSVFLAWLVYQAGSLVEPSQKLVVAVSSMKMNAGVWELFVRGILCNWLVCLAVWTSGRAHGDAAKLILIFWCLFAFIASGFEHCVANMTLLSLALMFPHGADVSLLGLSYNLLWVSLGNFVGGGVFVGMVYWFVSCRELGEQSSAGAGI